MTQSKPFQNTKFTPDVDSYIVSEGMDWNEAVADYMNGYIKAVVKDSPPNFELWFGGDEITIAVDLPAFDTEAMWSADLSDVLIDALETNDWLEPETDLEAIAIGFEKLAARVREFKEGYVSP